MFESAIRVLDKVTPGATRSLAWEVAMAALVFPASIMVNRGLGAEDRGLLALVVLIPLTVFHAGSCQWDRLLKGMITSGKISGREAWRRTLIYAIALSLVFVPISVVASMFYEPLGEVGKLWSVIFSGTFPIYFLAGCLSAVFVACGSIDGQYSMRLSQHGGYLILVFLLFAFDLLSVGGMVAVYFIQYAVSLGVGWLKREQILTGPVVEESVEWKPLLRGFLPHGLETAGSKIDIWAFSLFSAALPLGHYVGATALMTPVGLLSSALTSASTARLDWSNAREVRKYVSRTAFALSVALVILAVGGWLVGGAVLVWVLGDTFQGGEWMIPGVALVVVGNAAAFQLHSALQLSGRLDAYLFVQSTEPVLRLPLVLGLGWGFAESGIFAGMALGSVVKAAWCWRLLLKEPTPPAGSEVKSGT
jgi:hypothetical protein